MRMKNDEYVISRPFCNLLFEWTVWNARKKFVSKKDPYHGPFLLFRARAARLLINYFDQKQSAVCNIYTNCIFYNNIVITIVKHLPECTYNPKSLEINTDGAIEALTNAKNIIVVPGYGLCAARAQYPVAQIADILRKHGKNFRFGIHPVAGSL